MRTLISGKSSHLICALILKHGPMTIERGTDLHGMLGDRPSKTLQAYKRAMGAGWIVCIDGVYSLADGVAEYVGSMQEPMMEHRTEYVGQVAALRVYNGFSTKMPEYRVTRAECAPLNPRCNGRSEISKETLIRGASL